MKNLYPFVTSLPYQPPEQLFHLFAACQGAVFFDSALIHDSLGRYSFIAVDPFATLTCKNGQVHFNQECVTTNPWDYLKQQLRQFPLTSHPHLPPFQGGIAGFFSYDLYQYLEKIPTPPNDELNFPDLAVGFYDLVIGFDLQLQKAWLFSSGYPATIESERIERAKQRANHLLEKLTTLATTATPPLSTATIHPQAISSNFTEQTYCAMIARARDYIYAGDIFEVNLSQRFSAKLPATLTAWQLYQRLREKNPAPFSAYINLANTIIVAASPERFLKLTQQNVEARPIKGTCKRGNTVQEDQQLCQHLVQSAKDRAENIMIVDLLRNDLSRVCADYSVKVSQLCALETYATVHHLVSVINGTLLPQYNAIDLLQACFPGGSVSGAPKIRAMEIITELELTARGPYCGSIGYIGFDGCLDSAITIRSYTIKDNQVIFQAGGAIVSDSDLKQEYEETLLKAQALYDALTEL